MTKKSKRLHRTVEKIIEPIHSGEPEKAQITQVYPDIGADIVMESIALIDA